MHAASHAASSGAGGRPAAMGLLLDSALRDYEIKLDREFSAEVEKVDHSRNYRPEISSHHDITIDPTILSPYFYLYH
jgi:hypothetical protein